MRARISVYYVRGRSTRDDVGRGALANCKPPTTEPCLSTMAVAVRTTEEMCAQMVRGYLSMRHGSNADDGGDLGACVCS